MIGPITQNAERRTQYAVRNNTVYPAPLRCWIARIEKYRRKKARIMKKTGEKE